MHVEIVVLLVWFGLILYVPVNSCGHVETVSSPNHTYFLGKLDKALNTQISGLVEPGQDKTNSFEFGPLKLRSRWASCGV